MLLRFDKPRHDPNVCHLIEMVCARKTSLISLNNFYFLISQAIQLVSEFVDFLIRSIDLALEKGLLVFGAGSSRSSHPSHSPLPAPARTPETKPRKNPAPVPMEIDHPIVAVDIHGCGEEEGKQDNGEGGKEQQWKEHEAVVMAAAASFETEPAVRAMTHRIRHLAFALGTLKDPAASCGESFHPCGKRNICIRSLTPKQASGNALALGFNEGHGHSSWTPENSSKYRHDSHSSSTYWKEIPSIIPSTTQHGWPVGFIFLKHSSHVVALLGWWFFQ